MLKFAYTPGYAYRTNLRTNPSCRHIAPLGGQRALCGAEVVSPREVSSEFRFGVFDGTLCSRCRQAVLKAEEEAIYLGYDENAVEPLVLLAYARRNPTWEEPPGLNIWRERAKRVLGRVESEGFQNV